EDPLLTIDIGTHQGLFHLCWGQGEANQEQDVLEAPCIHLTRAVEDLKVAAEGCQEAQGDQGEMLLRPLLPALVQFEEAMLFRLLPAEQWTQDSLQPPRACLCPCLCPCLCQGYPRQGK
ncbi:hypothetical protein U0070_009050, partial [Myodes glareolus]